MHSPLEVYRLIQQAESGNVAALGNSELADEVLGFAFDAVFDNQGNLAEPGKVNEAIADRIINDEVLRSKNMTLQEELANAVVSKEKRLGDQIEVIPTIKSPNKTYNTHELMILAKRGLIDRQIGGLAVIAFRYHLPRAAAVVRKAGFDIVIPDMQEVGNFNPQSSLPWTRSKEDWIKRERIVIPYFAARNWI